MAACVFCEILAGDRQAYEIFRDTSALVFLDHRPLFPGHVLVVPTEHHETLVDMPQAKIGGLFETVQRVAGLVETTMEAAGTFVAMNNRISQSVPHLHVHVVPRNPKDGLRGFFWPRYNYAEGEIEEVQMRLKAGL